MLGGNWTAKAEADFVDVGHGDALIDPAFAGIPSLPLETDRNRYYIMKFGVNYLFGAKQPVLIPRNWNGFYAGLVGGTGVTKSNATDPTGATLGSIGDNGAGFTIGALAGYNWQFAPSWVAGLEGDVSYLGINHSSVDFDENRVGQPPIDGIIGIKTDWLTTLRGRLGYSTGPALLYVTGGGAWVSVEDSWSGDHAPPVLTVSSTKTLSGGTVGAGIETLLAGNWTARTDSMSMRAEATRLLHSKTQLIQFGSITDSISSASV